MHILGGNNLLFNEKDKIFMSWHHGGSQVFFSDLVLWNSA